MQEDRPSHESGGANQHRRCCNQKIKFKRGDFYALATAAACPTW
jgi:hypothetical protein